MFRNYFTVAIRNLLRNPIYAGINIFGLSIGIACSLIILLFIRHEFSYDRFHGKRDRLYRLVFEFVEPEGSISSPQMSAPVGPAMVGEFPEVLACTRFAREGSGFYTYAGRTYNEPDVLYADSSLFSMFSFELLRGDPLTALALPFSVVLSEETAGRIFDTVNPIGEVLRWNNLYDLTVTGIVKSPPVASHIRFTSLISFSTRYRDDRYYMNWNGGMQYYHYLELLPGMETKTLELKFPDFMYRHINRQFEGSGSSINASLQSISDIHLRSGYAGEMGPVGSMANIYIYSAIALFILFIACINFMNLTTAMSTKRAKEVGMRKAFGAARTSLARQFLGETLIMCLAGLVLALILVEVFLPAFGRNVDRQLSLYERENLGLLLGIPFLIMLTGILAGSYPAFYLSAFRPVNVLKGVEKGQKGYAGLRNGLVLFQFAVSIVLIVCTLVIYSQMGYIRSRDPGYLQESIMVLAFTSDGFKDKTGQLKERLAEIPDIQSTSATSQPPGEGFTSNGYRPEGYDRWLMFHAVDVDPDYIGTMGMRVVRGRGFSADFPTDRDAYMINETLARQLDWDNPVGKVLYRDGGDHKIIGVVRDFHFASLHEEIAPLVFTMKPYMGYDYLLVRFSTNDLPKLIGTIRKAWEQTDPDEPFRYDFLDETFERVYRTEMKMSSMLLYFAILSIIIACMGLFGLALYNTEQRTQEIGIRKVLGSSVGGVMLLFSGRFTKWVLLANFLAWPVAFLLVRQYMKMYAYHIRFPVWIFAVTALAVYLIALFTIILQSYRAGSLNPSDALRDQ